MSDEPNDFYAMMRAGLDELTAEQRKSIAQLIEQTENQVGPVSKRYTADIQAKLGVEPRVAIPAAYFALMMGSLGMAAICAQVLGYTPEEFATHSASKMAGVRVEPVAVDGPLGEVAQA